MRMNDLLVLFFLLVMIFNRLDIVIVYCIFFVLEVMKELKILCKLFCWMMCDIFFDYLMSLFGMCFLL